MLAHKATRALGLTFAVVDIGMSVMPDASIALKVIDVNPFPHVEGSTLELYVKNIQKWAIGPEEVLKPVTEDEGVDEFYVPPSAAEPPPMPRVRTPRITFDSIGPPPRRQRARLVEQLIPTEPPPLPEYTGATARAFSQYLNANGPRPWRTSPTPPTPPPLEGPGTYTSMPLPPDWNPFDDGDDDE